MTQIFRNAIGAIDLRHPLGHLAEHAAIVDFLKRFALDEIAGHLADEQNHRRGILISGVYADAGVGRAGAARDETNARSSGQLAVRFRHERCAAFLAADDQFELFAHVVHRVKHRKITFARHAKRHVDTVTAQTID